MSTIGSRKISTTSSPVVDGNMCEQNTLTSARVLLLTGLVTGNGEISVLQESLNPPGKRKHGVHQLSLVFRSDIRCPLLLPWCVPPPASFWWGQLIKSNQKCGSVLCFQTGLICQVQYLMAKKQKKRNHKVTNQFFKICILIF